MEEHAKVMAPTRLVNVFQAIWDHTVSVSTQWKFMDSTLQIVIIALNYYL